MTSTPNIFRKLSGIPDPARLESKKTALLMIEFQAEHFTGALPVEGAKELIEPALKIMNWADKHKIRTIHIAHRAKSPASPVFASESAGSAFFDPVVPGKKHLVQTKYAASAFSGSGLHTVLQADGIDTLILTGMPTPSAIAASAHDARILGYKCLVAADITAARDILSWDETRVIAGAQMQQAALADIADNYAPVMTSTDIMALPIEK